MRLVLLSTMLSLCGLVGCESPKQDRAEEARETETEGEAQTAPSAGARIEPRNEAEPAASATPPAQPSSVVEVDGQGTVLGAASRIETELKKVDMDVVARVNLVEPKVYQVNGGGVRLLVVRSLPREELEKEPARTLALPNQILVYGIPGGKVRVAYDRPGAPASAKAGDAEVVTKLETAVKAAVAPAVPSE